MERLLLVMDEVDEYVGLLRHLVVGVAADCSNLASRATGTLATQLVLLQIRIRGLN